MKFLKAALLCSCLTLFFACKKEKTKVPDPPAALTTDLTPGLPDKKGSIHGYFYASTDVTAMPNPSFYNIGFFAAFNDPGKNLFSMYDHVNNFALFNSSVVSLGNVSVGTVNFETFSLPPLNFGNNITYRSSFSVASISLLGDTWITEGNGPFKPINEKVSRGFPKMLNIASNYSLSVSNGYTVDINNGMISNYDSVIVSINFGPTSLNKRAGSGTSRIIFTPDELSILSSAWSTSIAFMAFNYSHRTINDRVYVFEMATKSRASLYVTP